MRGKFGSVPYSDSLKKAVREKVRTKSIVDNLVRKERKRKEREAMSEAEVKDNIRLTENEVAALNQIAGGRPMRNSTAVLQAIKLKMEYSIQKPAQRVDNDQKVQIEIVTLPPEDKTVPLPPYSPGTPTIFHADPPPEDDEEPDAIEITSAGPPDAGGSAQS